MLSRDDYGQAQSRFDFGEKLLIEPVHDGLVSSATLVGVENDQRGLAQPAKVLAQQMGLSRPLAGKVRQVLAQIEIELAQIPSTSSPPPFKSI